MSWIIKKSSEMPFEFVMGIAWLGDRNKKTLYIGLFWYIALTFRIRK